MQSWAYGSSARASERHEADTVVSSGQSRAPAGALLRASRMARERLPDGCVPDCYGRWGLSHGLLRDVKIQQLDVNGLRLLSMLCIAHSRLASTCGPQA